MKNKKLLLAVILLLGIGFAAVSTTLIMTGNVKIATNNADFDVKFTKAVLDGADISATAIIEDEKKITFSTKDLVTVGDISKLDFEVTNNSEMYDAVVSVACTAEGAKKDYYEITSSVTSPIVGKTKETGNVQVKLLKASVEDIHEEFTCTLSATAKERTTKAEGPQVYYAFGDPLTATDRTTNYTTLTYPSGQQAQVFVKLDADGVQKSVCIIRNGSLECFKINNYTDELAHINELFGEHSCISVSSRYDCLDGQFRCYVYPDGAFYCKDLVANFSCDVYYNGGVNCG